MIPPVSRTIAQTPIALTLALVCRFHIPCHLFPLATHEAGY